MFQPLRRLTPAGRWLLIAAVLLGAVWLVAPAGVPIYDGIGTDAPYRYVDPPSGAPKTPPPTVARRVVSVRDGRSAAGYANSGEVGPQISLYMPAGAFQVSASARALTVTAIPMPPKPPLPTDGHIVSNIYRIEATADVGTASLVGSGPSVPTLQMRSSDYKSGEVFEHLSTGRWRRAPTRRVGQDVYQTSAASLGQWALVQLNHPVGGSGPGINVGLLAAGITVMSLTGIIAVVRRWRLR